MSVIIVLICVMAWQATIGVSAATVIPTNEWVNFYSANTTLDGEPVPVGAVVDAYDPDGIHCGTFTVTTPGLYGFMAVYRDDPTTPSVDEGAEPGDTISFTINGYVAKPLGPDLPIWTAFGDRWEVGLGVKRPIRLRRQSQNSPNPFNPVTTIAYDLPEASDVTLEIYSVTGQQVATLVSARQEAGHYEVAWDGSGFANGVYFYRLEAGGFVETKRMTLIK